MTADTHPLRERLPQLGHGTPLPAAARTTLEARLHHDFSKIRVYVGTQADMVASSLGARGLTAGSDVVLGHGAVPRADDSTFVHELAHVAQQDHLPVPAGPLDLTRPQDASERAADSAARGASVSLHPATRPQLALQRTHHAPPTPVARVKIPPLSANLNLPVTIGQFKLFEATHFKVRVLAAVDASLEASVKGVMRKLARRVATDNLMIPVAANQVQTVIIAPTTTRFALLHGAPVLMLEPKDADVPTVAHEMGHALFRHHGLQAAARPAKTGSVYLRERVAHIYNELAATKPVRQLGQSHPAGLWAFDPSQWMKSARTATKPVEHAWDDPDEFFASAKEAYQIDLPGLKRSIARHARLDQKVGPAAQAMLVLLRELVAGRLPHTSGVTGSGLRAARARLSSVGGPSKVEATVLSGSPLAYLLAPATRPSAQPGPSPFGGLKPSPISRPGRQRSLIDDVIRKDFSDKIIRSVEDL